MANMKKTVKSLTKIAGWIYLLIKIITAVRDVLEGDPPENIN